MKVEELSIGDVVYANTAICDRSRDYYESENPVLAKPGARGIVTLIGHVLEQPERSVLMVRFEDENHNLGGAVGCRLNDLINRPVSTH